MKTLLEINNNNYGSTGNIMMNISNKARENGYRVYTACKNSKEGSKFIYDNQIFVGYWLERVISNKLAYYTSNKDHYNFFGTKSFLKQLDSIKPDIIHLHNIHGSFINVSMLFKYIKRNNIPVVWTLHDNWPFTGQCATYGCDRWKSGCGNCEKLHMYPDVYKFDKTSTLWNKKKNWFSNVDNMTLVTPSAWLKDMLKDSFLKDYPSIVINNGIDLDIFKPTESNLKQSLNIKETDYVLLAVAGYWNESKGIDVLIDLAGKLPENYRIIIIGTNPEVDKLLPDNIISIHHTYDRKELAQYYSMADLFINPTREDNFPTVNIEALACGCPVLTFNTGGSPEIIDKTCGSVVEVDDIDSFIEEIKRICQSKPYSKQMCLKRSKLYDMNDRFMDYIKLFDSLI